MAHVGREIGWSTRKRPEETGKYYGERPLDARTAMNGHSTLEGVGEGHPSQVTKGQHHAKAIRGDVHGGENTLLQQQQQQQQQQQKQQHAIPTRRGNGAFGTQHTSFHSASNT